MATVEEVLAACDEEYAQGLRPSILAHQQAFRPDHGRFWQGSPTHSEIPADGNRKPPDIGLGRPSDETVPWPASIRQLATLQAITCHKYVHPDGQGFLIVRDVMVGGDRYQATEDVGGYLGSEDWHRIDPWP